MEAHVKADKSVYNHYDKAPRFINKECGYKATTYIKGKKFSKQTLKLVTAKAKHCDI